MIDPKDLNLDGVTTKDGLLWRDGQVIDLPLADWLAQANQFQYAETLVRHLEKKQAEAKT